MSRGAEAILSPLVERHVRKMVGELPYLGIRLDREEPRLLLANLQGSGQACSAESSFGIGFQALVRGGGLVCPHPGKRVSFCPIRALPLRLESVGFG